MQPPDDYRDPEDAAFEYLSERIDRLVFGGHQSVTFLSVAVAVLAGAMTQAILNLAKESDG